MIHLLPEAAAEQGEACPEALARIAGLKRVLRLVDPFGGGPASDVEEEIDAACWASASDGVRRCFDKRSERTISAAAAGLDAVLAGRDARREPNPVSLRLLSDEIRAGLADLASLVRRPRPAPSPWG